MLHPGVYVIGRKVGGAGFATHQYVVLVPSKSSVLGSAKALGPMHYVILGAYSVNGYLRAAQFAESDHNHFRSIKHVEGSGVQSANFVVCWISSDIPVQRIFMAYEKFRKHEGLPGEIRYPEGPTDHLFETRFNSNSWAQSCIKWAAGNLVMRENNLPGLDIGNDRVIPEKYFI